MPITLLMWHIKRHHDTDISWISENDVKQRSNKIVDCDGKEQF